MGKDDLRSVGRISGKLHGPLDHEHDGVAHRGELSVNVPIHFLAYLAFVQIHDGVDADQVVTKALAEYFGRRSLPGFRSWEQAEP